MFRSLGRLFCCPCFFGRLLLALPLRRLRVWGRLVLQASAAGPCFGRPYAAGFCCRLMLQTSASAAAGFCYRPILIRGRHWTYSERGQHGNWKLLGCPVAALVRPAARTLERRWISGQHYPGSDCTPGKHNRDASRGKKYGNRLAPLGTVDPAARLSAVEDGDVFFQRTQRTALSKCGVQGRTQSLPFPFNPLSLPFPFDILPFPFGFGAGGGCGFALT